MSTKRPLSSRRARQGGVTLIELIIAMVIIGVAVAGMMAAFNTTSRNSADPVLQKQMAAVAEGLMEEIMLKPYDVTPNVSGTGRDGFTDVRDFNNYGLDSNGVPILGITDVSGVLIDDLKNYSVVVKVESATLSNVAAADALLITITVTNNGRSFVLTGWRMDYT